MINKYFKGLKEFGFKFDDYQKAFIKSMLLRAYLDGRGDGLDEAIKIARGENEHKK